MNFTPLPPVAVGVNEYSVPTVAAVAGVPPIVGNTAAVTIFTVAFADFDASAVDIAVTITEAGDGGLAGAKYIPALEIVPMLELPPAVPFTFHATVPATPCTVAVNCAVPPPALTVASEGDTATETDTGDSIVIDAPAWMLALDFDVAVMLTTGLDGTVAGAA